MGTFNFSPEHATKNSYQLMGEDIDNEYVYELQETIEKEIDNISSSMSFIDELGIAIDIDEVYIESGYYEGVRYIPNMILVIDTEYLKYHTSIEIDEDYLDEYDEACINEQTGSDYYGKATNFLWDKFIVSGCVSNQTKDKISKQIEKYFDKVDEIMNKYLTPYTTGWCASEVVTTDDKNNVVTLNIKGARQ